MFYIDIDVDIDIYIDIDIDQHVWNIYIYICMYSCDHLFIQPAKSW